MTDKSMLPVIFFLSSFFSFVPLSLAFLWSPTVSRVSKFSLKSTPFSKLTKIRSEVEIDMKVKMKMRTKLSAGFDDYSDGTEKLVNFDVICLGEAFFDCIVHPDTENMLPEGMIKAEQEKEKEKNGEDKGPEEENDEQEVVNRASNNEQTNSETKDTSFFSSSGEKLAINEIIDKGLYDKNIGGANANIAAGLAKLGVKTSFLGAVGTDRDGEDIIKAFEEAGVHTDFIDQLETQGGTRKVMVGRNMETGDREFLGFWKNQCTSTFSDNFYEPKIAPVPLKYKADILLKTTNLAVVMGTLGLSSLHFSTQPDTCTGTFMQILKESSVQRKINQLNRRGDGPVSKKMTTISEKGNYGAVSSVHVDLQSDINLSNDALPSTAYPVSSTGSNYIDSVSYILPFSVLDLNVREFFFQQKKLETTHNFVNNDENDDGEDYMGNKVRAFLNGEASDTIIRTETERTTIISPTETELKEIHRDFAKNFDIIKMTDEEAKWVFGIEKKEALFNPYRVFEECGAVVGVIITAGEKGASYYFDGVGEGYQKAYPVEAKETTGCGDAFLAGFLGTFHGTTKANITLNSSSGEQDDEETEGNKKASSKKIDQEKSIILNKEILDLALKVGCVSGALVTQTKGAWTGQPQGIKGVIDFIKEKEEIDDLEIFNVLSAMTN